jgi:hypothetical protein
MADYSELTDVDKLLLYSSALTARQDGKDGFLEAIQAADKIVGAKKEKRTKEHTAGFLQAVFSGEDPAIAYRKFPDASQTDVQGFAKKKMADDEQKKNLVAAEEKETRMFKSRLEMEAENAKNLAIWKQQEAQREAQDVEVARQGVGAGFLMQGKAPNPGQEPPSIDATDAGFLAQIQANPQTPPGRAAIAAPIAREQMAKERMGFLDEEKKIADTEKALRDPAATTTPHLVDAFTPDGTRTRKMMFNPKSGAYDIPATEWSAVQKTVEGASNGFNNYGLDEQQTEALNNAVSEGRLDIYKVNSRTAKIYAQQEMAKPGTNWNQLAAGAAFERTPSTSQTKALLNSINPMLEQLLVAGKALGNSESPLVNRPVNWAKEVTGNTEIVAFNNLRDDTIAEVERGLLGSGVLSDSKYLRAVKNVNSAQTYGQLRAAVDNMKIVINARMEALKEGPYPGAKTEGKATAVPAKIGRFTVEVE